MTVNKIYASVKKNITKVMEIINVCVKQDMNHINLQMEYAHSVKLASIKILYQIRSAKHAKPINMLTKITHYVLTRMSVNISHLDSSNVFKIATRV